MNDKRIDDRIGEILLENPALANRVTGVGTQSFSDLIEGGGFYVDKTRFIREWWEGSHVVELITRPRRFGKTLNLSMLECFFGSRYAGRADLFERFAIWREPGYRELQGSYPVIFLSFAGVKSRRYDGVLREVAAYLGDLMGRHRGLLADASASDHDKEIFLRTERGLLDADESCVRQALFVLSRLLYRYHGKKVIILIDEYDTPVTEGYGSDSLAERIDLMRGILNAALKTNPYLHRALLTGITQIAKESMFSDLNHLRVSSVTGRAYADAFGFTRREVEEALLCQDSDEMEQVRAWYDGFTIGGQTGIYNPWSIVNYLATRRFDAYWAHSGGHRMLSDLVLRGRDAVKEDLEHLLTGESIRKQFDEHIDLSELARQSEAIWPLLLASGYLRADRVSIGLKTEADLSVTNKETMMMLEQMVRDWFGRARTECNAFCKALLDGDVELMMVYLNAIALETMSFFDVGRRPYERVAERFYHGFVLGLIVDLREQYEITSNRESGYGRYDVLLRPRNAEDDGIIIEFKVWDENREHALDETAAAALAQIDEKRYDAELERVGVSLDRIRKYGFAFAGKKVMIRAGEKSSDLRQG